MRLSPATSPYCNAHAALALTLVADLDEEK
jgi:hypothetical protein